MISSLLRLVVVVISSTFVYRYRFQMVNYILSNQWMRRIAVRLFMNIPFVRDRMAGQMFRFQ
ncbi:hypothetical protein [Bacillus sp. Marseille-P3661]|uniref:hypothetical protein n=1 Tax=Bacillus sp. Marseille-P3661 TaxID=1936234 RepID=UPI000C8154B7|nr:hypothetical protein [Bacillus sp. Marseille-P3661]